VFSVAAVSVLGRGLLARRQVDFQGAGARVIEVKDGSFNRGCMSS